ncbi:MAG TPA: Slp family lipoprotein [Dissulfurispiraceae bacterium]|nr:Slp family lipoprotein [Dissulfurispiraceae bacterium]
MKKYLFVLLVAVCLVTACAPVFREEIMKNATLNPSIAELNSSPLMFEGKLYILGGNIVNTRLTKEGSLIEAVYAPVDSRGYLKNYLRSVRFLALYPKDKGILDPLIFRKNRDVTIAGLYKGTRIEKLDQLDYAYAYFEIVDFRLWEEPQYYYPAYYPYPYWWYDPWYGHWHDPWYGHRRWR